MTSTTEYRNADDVADQLRTAGLDLGSVRNPQGGVLAGDVYVESAKSVRCDVAGEKRKQAGAYRLHELRLSDGLWIAGAYWLDHGNSSFAIKLRKTCGGCGADIPLKGAACPGCGQKKFKAREIPPEQLEAHKQRMAELRKQAEAEAARDAERAAAWANAVWLKCGEITDIAVHDYLGRKQLASAHGARLFESHDGVVLDGGEKADFEYLAQFHGALVVPMCDERGRRRGLQFIFSREHHKALITRRERDKEYWPRGMTNDGLHFIVGGAPHGVCLVAEGFATACSIHEATGHPVAVAFDAGSLKKVGECLRKLRKNRVHLLYCADDDWLQHCAQCKQPTPVVDANCVHCAKPHDKVNAGSSRAAEAALATDGAWLAPVFTAPRKATRKGPTDFNDLRVLEGEQPVRAQIEAKLHGLGWVSPPAGGGGSSSREGGAKRTMVSPEEGAGRWSPVWSTDDIYYFDHHAYVVCAKPALTGRMLRHGWDTMITSPEWQEKPEVRLDQVDFDPACNDPAVVYNLWHGWPEIATTPGASCTATLELLWLLCSHEAGIAREIYDWVLRWLAYPLQHAGAKMQSAILMHGGQGAGKNTVFNNLLSIYGTEYAVEFGPKQLEKRFNALFSKKMFAIGNEIVASRDDLYHIKGQIKHMLTEKRWVVEAKNKDERWERNCCNFVFLSNELRPAAIDRGDRRHCVIWTPHVPAIGDPEREAYDKLIMAARAEATNGGAAALRAHLMRLDLSGFDEGTWPPMTEAKMALIEDNLDSRERFWELWRKEDVGGLPCAPCLSEDLFDAYRVWASKSGIGRSVALHSLIAFVRKQRGATVVQEHFRGAMGDERRMTVTPYPAEHPPNTTKKAWLGECIAEFRLALDAYRGPK